MALLENNPKQIKKVNIKFFCFLNYCVFLILFLLLNTNTTEAQEYATDRLFIKQYKKTKCKNEAERVIKKLKKTPEMTLEQEVLLIQNIWVKLRSNLPLSPGEKKLLKNLKEKGVISKKMRSKEIWKHRATQFKDIRMKCKQIP
tara:strand:+ start:384 stop:815 length:432 start_codon:yes stop_codon:yes gene_type:complete